MKKSLFLLVGLLVSLASVGQAPQMLPDQTIFPGNPFAINLLVSRIDSAATATASLYYANGTRVEQPNQPILTRYGRLLTISWSTVQTKTLPINERLYLEIKAGSLIRQGAYLNVTRNPIRVTTPGSLTFTSPVDLSVIPFSSIKDFPLYLSKVIIEATKDSASLAISRANSAITAINFKLDFIANGIFTSATGSQIQYDGHTWIKKSGPVARNGGTTKDGPTGYYYERQFTGPILPEWFGAIYYDVYYPKIVSGITTGYYADSLLTVPVVNSTSAIQAAINAAKNTTKWVHLKKGYLYFSQISIPDGMNFSGTVLGYFGKSPAVDGAVLVQLPGVNDDAIIFQATLSGGFYRVTSLNIHDFVLVGNNGNTLGNGINFRNNTGDRLVSSNHAILNGTTGIRNITIRNFPENGMLIRQGGVPAFIEKVNAFWNGGYGIRWDGLIGARSVSFRDCDGDGNSGGAVIRVAGASRSMIYIDGIQGEYRDAQYTNTTGFPAAQPYLVEVGDLDQTSVVIIQAGAHRQNNTANQSADAIVLVNTTTDLKTPSIRVSGVAAFQANATGNRSLLYDIRNDVRVPESVRETFYSLTTYHSSITGTAPFVVGTDGSVPTIPLADAKIVASGLNPALVLYDQDALSSKKLALFRKSGSSILMSTVDSLNAMHNLLYISQTGLLGEATKVEWTMDGTGNQTVRGGTSASMDLQDDGANADVKKIRLRTDDGVSSLQQVTDAGIATNYLDLLPTSAGVADATRLRQRLLLSSGISTLTANSATPNVGTSSLYATANTANTTITQFPGALNAQVLCLIIRDNFTTLKHNANGIANELWLQSGTDWKPKIGTAIWFIREVSNSLGTSSHWVEIGAGSIQGRKLTTAQRNALTGMEDGFEIYNIETHAKEYYNTGTSTWKTVTTN